MCVDKCPTADVNGISNITEQQNDLNFIFFCAKNLDYCFYDTDGTTILIDYCYISYATEVYLDRYCMPRPMNVYRENIEKTVKSYFYLWG